MGFNIGEPGSKVSTIVSSNIRAHFRHPALETRGEVKINYVVQPRDWHFSPDMIGLEIQPPFGLNIQLSKKAQALDLVPQALAFFAAPQTYRIALDTGMFNISHISQKIPFEIDAKPFTGEFYSRGNGTNDWIISLYTGTGKYDLLGEMRGPLFAHDNVLSMHKYQTLALPF
jgi:hypothetical protein